MGDDTVKHSGPEKMEQWRLENEEELAAWIKAGDDALRHFSETGLHLTDNEVDAWLARLEAGEVADPPPLHV